MTNIDIIGDSNPTSKEKIKLYKDIFGETPWGEGYICKNCGEIFSGKFMGSCSCGNSNIEAFYKNKELKDSFRRLSEKFGYQELIAKILDRNVGFIWGWQTDMEELNNDKLGLDDTSLSNLKDNIKEKFPGFDFSSFYYFAEIGVRNDFRGQDIAGNLYRENLERLKQRGEKYILVRTTRKSDVPYRWFLKEGYEVVYLYNDKQDRVILVYKIKNED